ncbi:MAG: hypothetical protein JSV49_12180, partial [Thermoplasmata archaeon]
MQKQSSKNKSNTISDGKLYMGLTNGNGFTNGFGSEGSARESSYRNGEKSTKTDHGTYTTGLTNGNGLSVGDGAVNGNGMTVKPNRIPLVRAKRLRYRLLGFAVAVFLVLAPLTILMIEIPEAEDGIIIDGDFRDWEGVVYHTDSVGDMSQHPDINIIESRIVLDDNKASVLLVVDGWMLEGDDGVALDQVHILLDSDADASTGYQYDGLGADYMVHAYGSGKVIHGSTIYTYDDTYRSSNKRAQNDWNAWSPAHSGAVACSGNKLEASIYLMKDSYNDDGVMFAVFKTMDYAGFTDRTDIVSTKPGYLVVDQSTEISGDIVESGSDVTSLRVVATAHESPIILNSISFANDAGVSVTTSKSLPVKIKSGQSREIMVSVDTSSLPTSSVFSLELESASVEIATEEQMLEKVPVTISGSGYTGYVEAAPSEIVIDGAFGDWVNVIGHSDDITESSTGGNPNIDIREYKSVEVSESLSFFLRVDGTMMEGTKILSRPLRFIEEDIKTEGSGGSGGGSGGPSIQPDTPSRCGYDYAYIMIDTDRNRETGYSVNSIIGAELMIRIVGQDGDILTRELYQYIEETNPDNPESIDKLIKPGTIKFSWIKAGDVDAANDAKRLEAQLSAGLLGLEAFGNVDYHILMTDWSGKLDSGEDPTVGKLGETGSVTAVKLDGKTFPKAPKMSNSRNPETTRASSRVILTNGSQSGVDLLPSDGDTLRGEYWDINKFEVDAGETIYIQKGEIAYISANFIFINGTIIGNMCNGSLNGTAGPIGTQGGYGDGLGGGLGGSGSTTAAGAGGGGGGYGGDGGDGGNGGGGATAGSGGAAFDTRNSLI